MPSKEFGCLETKFNKIVSSFSKTKRKKKKKTILYTGTLAQSSNHFMVNLKKSLLFNSLFDCLESKKGILF